MTVSGCYNHSGHYEEKENVYVGWVVIPEDRNKILDEDKTREERHNGRGGCGSGGW